METPTRRYSSLQAYGPDGQGKGPEEFIKVFSSFILPRLLTRGYPNASVDLEGNRAIKFEFNEPVDIDDWGPVDPYVDLIVGLSRAEGRGLWIPNRRRNGWDAADPEHHTWLMTKRDAKSLRVHRAQTLRLAKRAVKRDGLIHGRVRVMCPWNLSALALELVEEVGSTAEGLRDFLAGASDQIARGLTEDPSPVVEEPIKLPDGVSLEMASQRLAAMAAVVQAALDALSRAGARRELESLFGDEIDAIRSREDKRIREAYGRATVPRSVAPWGFPSRRRSPGHTVRSRSPAWFDDVVACLMFERDARRAGMTIERTFIGRPRRLRYRFAIDVPVHDDERVMTAQFASLAVPSTPIVHIDGPPCLLHRWGDWSLCMWLDTDPPDRRWVPNDGLLALVGHVEQHAYGEAECRAGRPWPKAESPGLHPRPRQCPSCSSRHSSR